MKKLIDSHTASSSNSVSQTRRRLLAGSGMLGGVLAADAIQARAEPAPATRHVTDAPTAQSSVNDRISCYGEHQQGITTPRPNSGMVAAFDILATNRAGLERLFHVLTERVAFLTHGGPAPTDNPDYPPPDSGILGPVVTPDALTITVSVGSSLFDERFGLADRKPLRLKRMTSFPNDALDPARCHGDLLLQFCAHTPDTTIHALRDIVKHTPDLLYLRWKQEGTVPSVVKRPGVRPESARNLLGFRDGSANPDGSDHALMERVVWVQPGDGEPDWAVGGSYQAVRIIRNFVERWDRTPLQEQQTIFGRFKASGAPLDGKHEYDIPNYAADPKGKHVPLDSHIRRANDRTPEAQRHLILRRPFNYSNGVERNGQLDMGLLFICYQADLDRGFIAVQTALNGEPLEEYIKPAGGGYFFALPGIEDRNDFFGRLLLKT
jgi:deferrochelatase/peroxidase EfeB